MIWDILEDSSFDKYFQNPNITIEQLLVDESILTEMQNLNPLLLEFLNKNLNDVITKLVKYVTVMPTEAEGYDRCHKLPYVSSEMLAIKSQIFYTAFFPADQGTQSQHLTNLLAFLDSESVESEILLGYFEKVTNNLYNGKKLSFISAVVQNMPLFTKNLDKETIGNLLTSCVVLLDEKQGTLFQERKKIVTTLVSNLVSPSVSTRPSQVRSVCSSALVEIIGKHQTFSSGDELLNYILCYCGELLLIYSQSQIPEICRFLIGLLTKSTKKIYNPETDSKVSIFSIPEQHQKLLQGYLPLYLHYCKKQLQTAAGTIWQQNGLAVKKINPTSVDYLKLVAVTLENGIDEFLQEEQHLIFAWDCMRKHPRNDIALVQVDKIFLYAISDRSKTKDKLHQMLIDKFKIVDRLNEIFKNSQQEKLLRPHLFQMWNQLKQWTPADLRSSNEQWNKLCQAYEALIPLHTKATGLNYNRPTNAKMVIDEEDARAAEQEAQENGPHLMENKVEKQEEQIETPSQPHPQVPQGDFFTEKEEEKDAEKGKEKGNFDDFSLFDSFV